MTARLRTSMPSKLGDLTVREDHYLFEVSRFIEKAMRAKSNLILEVRSSYDSRL